MNVLARIIVGLMAGTVTYVLMFHFILKRKPRTVKPAVSESRLEILKKYRGYSSEVESERYPVTFALNRTIPDILLKYDYLQYSGIAFVKEDDLVFAMLDFVCDHFMHGSHVRLPRNHSMVAIIEACERCGSKTNCRGLSLLLAELLRMNGIKARHVTCKPYEEPFSDCHVVVDCVMPSGVRIMLDPTYRLYLVDDNGEYASIERLREGMIQGLAFHPNSNASYNGGAFSYDDYKEYMTKNLLRFSTNIRLDDSLPDREAYEIELIPEGYTTEGFPRGRQFTTDSNAFWNI